MGRIAKVIAVAFMAALAFAAPASAQFASRFSWGPTMPLFRVSLEDSIEDRTSFLATGAGVFFAGNLAPTPDGRWRMVTFAVPVFVNYENGFGLDAGFTVGTLNNLLSVGIGTRLIQAGDVVDDVFSRESTYVLVGASLNFGGGGQGTVEQNQKLTASAEPVHTRPPGYVGW